MTATVPVCQQCGAPWTPDVTGACRFCRVVAPPPTASGTARGPRAIDADAFLRLLSATVATDPDRPLDGLAADLHRVAGDRCTLKGHPVEWLQVGLDDWQYQAWTEQGDLCARAVHTVRGVVLKRQSLPFDEWLAALAGHVAEFAQSHSRVYEAIVALDRP